MWQEKPTAIVMLTNLEEGNKTKCEQYWPGSGKKIYGPFSVIITDQQILADYVVRTFVISVSKLLGLVKSTCKKYCYDRIIKIKTHH